MVTPALHLRDRALTEEGRDFSPAGCCLMSACEGRPFRRPEKYLPSSVPPSLQKRLTDSTVPPRVGPYAFLRVRTYVRLTRLGRQARPSGRDSYQQSQQTPRESR